MQSVEYQETKKIVKELLTKDGTLALIKAQLARKVVDCLHEPAKEEIKHTQLDSNIYDITKEVLKSYGLQNTLTVFEAEWGKAQLSNPEIKIVKLINQQTPSSLGINIGGEKALVEEVVAKPLNSQQPTVLSSKLDKLPDTQLYPSKGMGVSPLNNQQSATGLGSKLEKLPDAQPPSTLPTLASQIPIPKPLDSDEKVTTTASTKQDPIKEIHVIPKDLNPPKIDKSPDTPHPSRNKEIILDQRSQTKEDTSSIPEYFILM
ncbi:hypothetical protein HDV01_003690 [Terramyces sp. JEL0728]|nr:hypothetical protein HDV01_003690 [Terramyces sp. JEL0728]